MATSSKKTKDKTVKTVKKASKKVSTQRAPVSEDKKPTRGRPRKSEAVEDVPKKKRLRNSVASKYPSIARHWHAKKNGPLKATMVPPASRIKVWWKCYKGHEWEAVVYSRTLNGTGCPFCRGKRAGADNNMALFYPELVKEWVQEKNGNLTPSMVTNGSKKRVWWRCANGHEWEAAVYDRTTGKGCPYCSHRRIGKDNNLKAVYPEIAADWHPTKNGSLKATDVFPSAGKKVWWKCKKGHEWQTTINSRGTLKTGCPYCTGHRVPPEESLQNLHKNLARQWDTEKNGRLTPLNVSPNSKKTVWWKDNKGNSFCMMVRDRALKGKGFKDLKR